MQTPMTAFNPFMSFDPMAYWKLCADTYATFEAHLVKNAQGAVAQWAQLAQDAIGYSGQLAAESRKLALENMRKLSQS
ncbi:MAG TPA: hypothetical protein VGM88_09780 [Kofleriaceae bacterium]|jgi:hypothetical protein